jgi:hypothetical protein
MALLHQILPAVIVALLMATGVCAVGLGWPGRGATAVLVPCAAGLGYICGHLMATGWTGFPPVDTTNWLPYAAFVAALLGVIHETSSPPAWIRLPVFALFSAGVIYLLLRPRLQGDWTFVQGSLWVGCLAIGMVALGVVCDRLCRSSPTAVFAPVLLLIIPCGGAAIALMLSGSLLLGQLAAVLTAAVFGSVILGFRHVTIGKGVTPVVATLFSALVVSGYFFAELPAQSALLLAVAPALTLVRTGNLPGLWAVAVRAGLVAAVVLIAVITAFLASPPLEY